MNLEDRLRVWVRNQLLDEAAARRIREFEDRRSVYAQRTRVLTAAILLALSSGIFALWSATTVPDSGWEDLARFATYFSAAGGSLLLVYWKFRSEPKVPPLAITAILATTASLAFAAIVTRVDSLELLLDLLMLGALTGLLAREQLIWMLAGGAIYLGLALAFGKLELQRWAIALLGLSPGVLMAGTHAWSAFSGTAAGKALEPRLKALRGTYFQWAGPMRGNGLLVLAVASALSAILSKLPGLGPFLAQKVDPQRWILVAAAPLFLSLLPRERPVISAMFAAPAWGLIGYQVLRFDSKGPLITAAGTGYASWKVIFGGAILLSLGAMAQNYTRGKKTLWQVLELGPVGFVGFLMLLALL